MNYSIMDQCLIYKNLSTQEMFKIYNIQYDDCQSQEENNENQQMNIVEVQNEEVNEIQNNKQENLLQQNNIQADNVLQEENIINTENIIFQKNEDELIQVQVEETEDYIIINKVDNFNNQQNIEIIDIQQNEPAQSQYSVYNVGNYISKLFKRS